MIYNLSLCHIPALVELQRTNFLTNSLRIHSRFWRPFKVVYKRLVANLRIILFFYNIHRFSGGDLA